MGQAFKHKSLWGSSIFKPPQRLSTAGRAGILMTDIKSQYPSLVIFSSHIHKSTRWKKRLFQGSNMKMETPKRGSISEVSRSGGIDKNLKICTEHIQGPVLSTAGSYPALYCPGSPSCGCQRACNPWEQTPSLAGTG